jgi:hypothetical protein
MNFIYGGTQMKKNNSSLSTKEAEAYLRKEGFKKLTKKQCEDPEWKHSIEAIRCSLKSEIV